MKRFNLIIVLLLPVIIFTSCNKQNKPQYSPKELYPKIQGDWVSKSFDDFKTNYHFCFADTNMFFYLPNVGGMGNYELRNNSIITHYKTYKKQNISKAFDVESISDSSMRISFQTGTRRDTADFHKLNPMFKDNNFQIEKITFRTFPCYGACSTLNFEVNSDGKCFYQGIKWVDSIGYFEGQMPERIWNLLLEKSGHIDFSSLKKHYRGGVTDVNTYYLVFQIKDKRNNTSRKLAFGIENYDVPINLEIFTTYMFYALDNVKLTRTNRVHKFDYGIGDKKLMNMLLHYYYNID